MKARLLIFYFLFLFDLFFPLFAMAQDSFDFLEEEGLEFSFEEETEQNQNSKEKNKEDSSTSPLRYSLDYGVSYRLGENQRLINNRSKFQIEFAGNIGMGLYAKLDSIGTIYWRDDHQSISRGKDYDLDSLTKEAWVQKSYDSISFKIGLQSVVWGDVEGSPATDILNPIDNREFLFVDFEDVRIGQASLSLTIFGDHITWEGFITPKPELDKNPPAGSLYAFENPLDALPHIRAEPLKPEYGLRLKSKAGASEFAFLFAQLTPNQLSYDLNNFIVTEVAMPFILYGFNFNYPIGPTLVKLDLGYKTKQGINTEEFALIHKDILDIALGFETTLSEHVFSASMMVSQIMDWKEALIQEEQTGFYNLGWSKNYFNEDLSINFGLLGALTKSDKIANLLIQYKWNDELTISSNLFVFSVQDPTSLYYAFRDEDRLELKGRLQF